MFGLEDQKKKKKSDEFIFEFEKEAIDLNKKKDLTDRLSTRVEKLKEILRGGENQENFEQFAVLLQGYLALVKVMARVSQKKQPQK